MTVTEYRAQFDAFFGEQPSEDNGPLIASAIAEYGARRVYDAAAARMRGDAAPLAACGLHASDMCVADRIMTLSFAALSAGERTADWAATS